MSWRLIEYEKHPGKYNMQFDLDLAKDQSAESPILRFYGWTPHCISLGANQSFSDIDLDKANQNNIDIVKRPTGGRAILHSHELTYSVIFPNYKNLSGKKLYEDISNAIVYGLKNYHPDLEFVILEKLQPHFPSVLNEPSGSICFASSAKSEIKFNGKKLVGSAQRKLGTTILQHGSILIDDHHLQLVDYLNIDENAKIELASEMKLKTTDIKSITDEDVNIFSLQSKIIEGFEKVLAANFQIEELKEF